MRLSAGAHGHDLPSPRGYPSAEDCSEGLLRQTPRPSPAREQRDSGRGKFAQLFAWKDAPRGPFPVSQGALSQPTQGACHTGWPRLSNKCKSGLCFLHPEVQTTAPLPGDAGAIISLPPAWRQLRAVSLLVFWRKVEPRAPHHNEPPLPFQIPPIVWQWLRAGPRVRGAIPGRGGSRPAPDRGAGTGEV